MSDIRLLQQDDYEQSLLLAQFAFQRKLLPDDRAQRLAAMDNEQIWGCFVDGQLAAQLAVLPLNFWINGQVYGMGGIALVASWPEYRRGGMVGQLLRRSLAGMREQGQVWSALAPFSYAFYRKYGWEAGIDYIRYEIDVGKLPRPEVVEGSQVRRIAADEEMLAPIYETYAASFNGMLARTPEWWRTRVFGNKEGIVSVYRNSAGEAEGYLFYQVKEKVLTIHELVCLTEEARLGLWRFISQHDSMISKVVCRAPVGDSLPFLLAEPRIRQEVVPYFMVRIVDVSQLLTTYRFASGDNTDNSAKPFYLLVDDAAAEWNDGLFRIYPQRTGSERVCKLDPNITNNFLEPILSCDIQTLSALLIGYQSASLLHRIGRLRGDEEEVLRFEQYLPAATAYLMDYF